MITIGVVFLILAFVCAGYLIWRLARHVKSLPDAQVKAKVKTAKAKMTKCQHCEQKTKVDESYCQWCHYPLFTKEYQEPEKKVKERKPEKPKQQPITIKTPFFLSCAGVLLLAILVILLLGGAFYGLARNGLLGDEIQRLVYPPKPVVVSKGAYVTGLGDDYTIVIRSTVRNEGGAGNVVVRAELNTPERFLTKRTVIHLKSGETKLVEIAFPEAKTPWLRMIIRTLFGGFMSGIKELTDPDIDYEVYVEHAP